MHDMANFYIETRHLILRNLEPSDLKGMFRLDSDPLVHTYLGNKPVKTLTESEDIIKAIVKQYHTIGIGRWAAIEKSSGDFIGWSGLRFNNDLTYNDTTNFYDVGYRFIPKYWGKGYATESAVAALDYGFNQMNLETINGIAEIGNLASNRVLQKIGLQFINTFNIDDKKAHWYQLKKDEYAKAVS